MFNTLSLLCTQTLFQMFLWNLTFRWTTSMFICTLIVHYYSEYDTIWNLIWVIWIAYSVQIFRFWPYVEFSIFQSRRGICRYYSGIRSILWTCIQRSQNSNALVGVFMPICDSCLFMVSIVHKWDRQQFATLGYVQLHVNGNSSGIFILIIESCKQLRFSFGIRLKYRIFCACKHSDCGHYIYISTINLCVFVFKFTDLACSWSFWRFSCVMQCSEWKFCQTVLEGGMSP